MVVFLQNLSALPESFTELTGLQELSLIRTKLQGLPEGISALSMLSVLNLAGCTSLEILPEGIGGLSRVRTLNLMACKDVQVLPESIRGMVSLKDLSLLKCTGLWALPDALTSLQDLQRVDIRLCSQEVHDSLESLQALPGAVDGHFSKVSRSSQMQCMYSIQSKIEDSYAFGRTDDCQMRVESATKLRVRSPLIGIPH